MAATYGVMNLVTSFGFCVLWRRACVDAVDIHPGATVFDLMTGMGECWPLVHRRLAGGGTIVGVDISPAMVERAERHAAKLRGITVRVVQEDVLASSIPDGVADCVVSAFGVKTFSKDQQAVLARQLHRILRPGAPFSLVEISVPTNRLLRPLYLFYLRHVIPLLGRLFLGNPDTYRYLSVYTERFGDSHELARLLAAAGLEVRERSLFFGCATALSGMRPARAPRQTSHARRCATEPG